MRAALAQRASTSGSCGASGSASCESASALFSADPLSRSRRSLVRAAFVEGGRGAKQNGLSKRLVGREFQRREHEEADVHKLSDIMAVMGLAVVFVGIAMFIACWG